MSNRIYLALFSFGVVLHRFFWQLPSTGVLVGVFLSCLCCVYIVESGRIRQAFVLTAVLISGLAWANWVAGNILENGFDVALEKQDVVVSGKVTGVPVQKARYSQFDFVVNQLEFNGNVHAHPNKIRLKSYHKIAGFGVDQNWRLTVRLKRSRGLHNPGGQFDYESWLYSNRFGATGYVRESAQNQMIGNHFPVNSFSKLRSEIASFLAENFSGSTESAVLSALLVGVRGDIPAKIWQTFRDTGTIHLVAISGLHISFVTGLVIWLTGRAFRLTGRWQTTISSRDFGLVCGVLAAVLYALLAGMTIPTRRALIMVVVIATAYLGRRNASIVDSLNVSLFVILAVDPLSAVDNGFWLSFSAVSIIALVVTRGRELTSGLLSRCAARLKQWLTIQLSLSIGMAPILIVLFNQVSIIAPLANFIAIPVVTFFVIPLAMMGLFLKLLGAPQISLAFFGMAAEGLAVLLKALELLAAIPGAVWLSSAKPVWLLVFGLIGILILRYQAIRLAPVLAIVLIVPVFIYTPLAPAHGEFRYTMLDVGQGLASVIETENHTLIFDTGPHYQGGLDSGYDIVLPFLQFAAIDKIDKLVVSHKHNDHAGGLNAIIQSIDIDELWSGAPEQIKGSRICLAGQQWQWDGVEFFVLWPTKDHYLSADGGNNASCVIRVQSRQTSLLLTGDIEKEVEAVLVEQYGDNLKSDFLQVPHQGSRTSSTAGFLARVEPHTAFVSAGYKNRFKHPHKTVVDRYEQSGIGIFSTAISGALILESRHQYDGEYRVAGEKDNVVGYWYNR